VFATLAGRLDDAEDLHRRIERATRAWPLPEKAWRRVEDALEERSVSLSSDPYYGLLLHNGAVYADAFLFAQVAAAYFTRPGFPRDAAERRVRFAAARKALLTRVLVGLASAERRPGYPTRRAVLRQIDDLHLPDDLADATRSFARRAFEKGVDVRAVLRDVRSREMKRFVLEQTVLASLVDGRRSDGELSWLKALAQALGVSAPELTAVELGFADFYAQNREVVDVFNMSAGAERMGAELVDTLQSTLRKNYKRLLQELKETGELSVLLTRAARGQRLSAEEKKAMRQQLIDIAKVIPALAIFTAPGGVLLLVALARVLRFDLLPSAFHQDPEEVDELPSAPNVLSLKGRRR
jgi:LETM1-like protein